VSYPAPASAKLQGMPPWVMAQTWEHLLFAHWEVDPERLARLIPSGLEIDLWEGRAWVGILPFRMTDVHGRLLPALPGSGRFLETNVRTYVRRRGRPGIYFFSLEATSVSAVRVAQSVLRLPYRHADGVLEVKGDRRRYVIRRREQRFPYARLSTVYSPLGSPQPAVPGSLEHFLTERYRLFVEPAPGVVLGTEIEHPPWRIAPAAASLDHDGLIPPELGADRDPDLLHLAETQHVRVWPPTRV
jgi:hypothetical protein